MAARLLWARSARRPREAAMEGPAVAGGALSAAEKEKLREKLALLRREYSETVRRLRRARRAERARSGGRGAEEEGGRGERSPAGSREKVSPSADKHETPQLQTNACFDLVTEEKTSVTSKHVPEFSNNEVSQQDSLQAESIRASQENLCCEIIRTAPEEKKKQTSRHLMKLRRRTKAPVSEERESVRDVHLSNADETAKNQIASPEELRSPVFRRSSLSNTEENNQRASRPAQGEENSFNPPNAAFGVVKDMLEDSVPPGEPELFPCALRDSSNVWQPESPCAVATSDNHEPARLCSENSDSFSLDTSGDGGKESSSIMKQTDSASMCEDQGELHRLLDLMSENEVLPADGNNSITNDSKSCEGNQSHANSLNPFPTDLTLSNVEELLENQQADIQSRLSHLEKVTAPESALNSCTVVEGLLFPVEYYVRTTRRMSNCQRKVDLDAVILSQLGRSKKGQRRKCKQKDANSGQSSQERAENHLESGIMLFPFLGAENDSANSSSPQKSLPASSGSSTSLGSISQSSITSTKQDQRRTQRKEKEKKGRRKSTCKPLVHHVSQELTESLDLVTTKEGCLLSNECQSENVNSDANLEKSSDEGRLSAAAALALGEPEASAAIQPTSADPPPAGSQVLGKCHKALLEQVQNPLQNSDSLNPGIETFASRIGDVEVNLTVRQADRQALEHVKNPHMQGACKAEQLLAINVPPWRCLRSSARQSTSQVSKDANNRGRRYPTGSESPASLGLPATDSDTCGSLFSFRNLQWLAPQLGVRDFDLPDEEFGLLKLEKLESSPMNDLEVFVPSVFGDGVASEDTQDAQMNPEGKCLKSNLILTFKNGLPKLPHIERPDSKKAISTHELLLTPMGAVLAGAPTQPESQISSSVFPVVGATPAVLPPVLDKVFPSTPSVPPSQTSLHSSKGAPAQVVDDGERKDSAVPLHLHSCGAGSARKEEEEGTTFPLEAEGGAGNKSDDAVTLEKHQQSESKEQRTSEQKVDVAVQLTPLLLDGLTEENLQLVSKLKDSSTSCAVDVSTVWWEAAGCRELCVVTACESSVSLWKPLASDRWGKVYTWQLREIPVIQLVPLPDTCNLVCIALGDLEIGEIRLLLYSSENDSFKQSLVKTGNIKAVLGLKDRRLVSSSRTLQEQQVEIVSLSETGRSKDGQTLMPPEESVLAFAEVEGMRDALVGTTAVNSIVVWNLKTGQLLKKMHVGYSYPASICHRVYSDSGLLFVVLSHPHAKESESCGNPAFRVIAFNPKTSRSTGVMFSSLPPGHTGRYLEGDVKGASAAAVLTSGAIAVWDLLLGQCTALLPPDPAGSWALARWATVGSCLLAGQWDGTVCLYRYRQPQPGAA
ncbi:partner and localizer of BRCA2 [Falco naumanni]|uniref:partner and localizer of BRCA2 n=1 Tax=Falco naumanni TaxID=148594 RepID=UPI001ADE3EF1|nr:partner and localizer of BRCA2 [Falco naumanni]